MPNFQTRLPLSALATTDVSFDTATNLTKLTLTFNEGQTSHIAMSGDESEYLSVIANGLLTYSERVQQCHS